MRRHGKHRESGQLHPPLRLSVKDMSFVDVQALKDNHATGIVQLNQHNLQVIIGPQV
ncbi:PTS maltose transporter subunit IIBC [Salmonella enterica subsp. enterica]|nr:PTS maltose transporter subunit IIBC [Salmonella enterica subsp. enterica]